MKPKIEKSLTRGIDWLIAQQADDGGWHSKTYGQLKDGAAVTTLILDSLSLLPLPLAGDRLVAAGKASEFLLRGIQKRGTVAGPDGSLDFPTYAAALWITAHSRFGKVAVEGSPLARALFSALGESLRRATQAKLVKYLVAAQVAESRGFQPQSPSYGGWDFLGPDDAQGITTGTNISVTRYVLEALQAASPPASKERQPPETSSAAVERGKAYVLRCQQADGGFAFTCEPASLNNKAAYSDTELTKARSYGTATCDGIRALIACGVKSDEEPVGKAIAWLAKRTGLELVPGFEGFPPEAGWDRGLRFYYYASLSRVLPHFPLSDRTARGEALTRHIISLQKDDGQWVNESDRMRENDPLIATALAIVALT